MPLFKDKSLDADIKVNWQKRTVSFEKRTELRKNFNKVLIMSFLASLIITVFLLYINNSNTATISRLRSESAQVVANKYINSFSVYSSTTIMLLSIFSFVFMFSVLLLPNLSAYNERIRKFTVNNRTKKSTFFSYLIPNPSGLIKLDIHGLDPIVDLEFSETISKNIESVNLVKIPLTKHQKRIQLQINIIGQPNGELLVKEYF